jgi:hypothetical protein
MTCAYDFLETGTRHYDVKRVVHVLKDGFMPKTDKTKEKLRISRTQLVSIAISRKRILTGAGARYSELQRGMKKKNSTHSKTPCAL